MRPEDQDKNDFQKKKIADGFIFFSSFNHESTCAIHKT